MHFDENLPKSNVDLRADRNFLRSGWICGVFVCSVGNIDGAYRTTLFLGLKALGHCVNCPEIKDAMLGLQERRTYHNALGFHIEYKAINDVKTYKATFLRN
jgi:hypothetical protein